VRVLDDIVIQAGIPEADHVHADVVAIEKLPVVPAAAAERLAGVTVKAHAPAWVTE
jgi:hypothetical protein